jgi:hypothetical protein
MPTCRHIDFSVPVQRLVPRCRAAAGLLHVGSIVDYTSSAPRMMKGSSKRSSQYTCYVCTVMTSIRRLGTAERIQFSIDPESMSMRRQAREDGDSGRPDGTPR